MSNPDIATLGLRVDARQVADADRQLDRFNRTGARTEQQADRTNAAMARMARMAAVVASALSAQELIKQADAWASLQGRLALVTSSQQQLAKTTDDLFKLSQRTRSSLGETIDLYTKIARSTQDLNKTDAERLRLTETINKATIISGGAASSAAAGLQQLGQALGSGVLRGEEFNSVMENTPRLAQALANGMGRTTAELRAMAEAGKLSTDVVLRALESQAAAIDAEFARMPTTVSQAMTQIQNAFLRTVGVFDQQNKLSSGLASSLGTLAANMETVAVAAGSLVAVGAAKWIAGLVQGLTASISASRAAALATLEMARADATATAQASLHAAARHADVRAATLVVSGRDKVRMATQLLIPAERAAAMAADAHSAAMARLTVAQRAASLGSTALASTMAFLGGPIGAIVTVLGIAATAWTWYKSKQEEANAKAAQDTEKSTEQIVADLEKQNAKLRERIELSKQAGMLDTAQKGGEAAERLASTLQQIQSLQAKIASGNGDAGDQVALITLQGIYDGLARSMGQVAASEQELAAGRASSGIEAWLEKNSQYLSDTERLQTALKKAREELKVDVLPADIEQRIRDAFGKKAAKEIDTARKSAEDYIATLKLEAQMLGATEQQQFMLNAAAKAAEAPTAALRMGIMQAALAYVTEKDAADAAATEKERFTNAVKAQAEARYEEITAAQSAVDQAQREVDTYGMGAAAITRYTIAKLEAQKVGLMLAGATEGEIAHLDALIAKQGELLNLQNQRDDLDQLFETSKVQSFGDALRDAFGEAGSGLAQLSNALQDYLDKQDDADKARAKAKMKYAGDDKRVAREVAKINAQEEKDRIGSYAAMAGAAKGFFKEHTTGYKVMEAAERGFRMFELAMNAQVMFARLTATSTTTAAAVAGNTTLAASSTAAAGVVVGANTAIGTSAAAAAVATQGMGDPISAWPRIAAMAALMASIGFAVKGRGSKQSVSESRQKAQGTGTVLGDKSAKSASIARALDLVASNSNIELSYTAGMLNALRSIDSKIGSFASLLVRTTGVSGDFGSENNKNPYDSKALGLAGAVGGGLLGAAGGAYLGMGAGMLGMLGGPIGMLAGGLLGALLGKSVIGKIGNAIFGGKQTVEDTGFMLNKTSMAAVLAGQVGAMQYADIKKDGGLFSSDKRSTKTANLSADGNRQIAAVLESLYDTVNEAGKLLGLGGDAFTARLNAFVVDIGKISLKDKTGEEIEKELEAAFSKVGDQMAAWGVQGLAGLSKVGEGYLETLVRVASNYANLDSILMSVGMTFGQTGLASLAARERLIDMAGGIEELAAQSQSFAENFLTEAERLAPVQKYVTEQLAAMNLAHLDSRDAFKQHVLGLNLAIPAEMEQYVALMKLQDAFAKTHAATVDLTKSEQEIADERADLLATLDDLTLTEAQKLAKERAGLAEENRALWDQVQAAQAAKDAQDAARDSLRDLADEYRSLSDSLTSFGLSLINGNLSTLTVAQQEAEARRQYKKVAEAAAGGDIEALRKFEDVAQQFLSISQKANGGDARYMQDYASVLAMTDKLAAYTDERADTALLQLDAAERQIASIENLGAILRGSQMTLDAIASNVAPITVKSGTEEMLRAEMSALREQIKASDAKLAEALTNAASLQASEGRRVAVETTREVVGAISTLKPRATASNTAATLDA